MIRQQMEEMTLVPLTSRFYWDEAAVNDHSFTLWQHYFFKTQLSTLFY